MPDTQPATPTDARGNPREAIAAPDVRAWRKRVTSTFAAGGRFVAYRRAPEWAAGVHDPLDEVEELLAAGHAEAVVKLAEDAHRRAETALNRIDDSAGWLTDISHRLARIYQAAVARACPDPRSLADRLFKLEVDSHTVDTFHRAAATYADKLRAEGITRYRELVEAAWAEADHSGPRWENFRLQQARIAVAIAAGDADELIAVKSDELHSPYDHHEIAQTLADTGRTEEAIDWARRGLEQHADQCHQTPKLRCCSYASSRSVLRGSTIRRRRRTRRRRTARFSSQSCSATSSLKATKTPGASGMDFEAGLDVRAPQTAGRTSGRSRRR